MNQQNSNKPLLSGWHSNQHKYALTIINDPGFFNSSLDSTVTNFGGVIGAYLSNFQYNLFGLSAWFFILYLLILSMHCFFNLLEKNWMFQNDSKKYLFGLILLIISISSLQDHRIPFDFNIVHFNVLELWGWYMKQYITEEVNNITHVVKIIHVNVTLNIFVGVGGVWH